MAHDVPKIAALALVLAFDLRTLQKHRYGWRDLFTLYGLASAAYGSTIVVAVASTLGGKDVLSKIWEAIQWLAGTALTTVSQHTGRESGVSPSRRNRHRPVRNK